MSAQSPLVRWLRILCALVALAFGVLALASGVVGGQSISFGGSQNHYYRIVVTPLPYFWLWGVAGLAVGTALLLFSLLHRRKEPQ